MSSDAKMTILKITDEFHKKNPELLCQYLRTFSAVYINNSGRFINGRDKYFMQFKFSDNNKMIEFILKHSDWILYE